MYSTIEAFGIENDTIMSIGDFAILWGRTEEKYFERCCTNNKLNKLKVECCADSIIEYIEKMRLALLEYYQSPNEILQYLCFRKSDTHILDKIDHFLNEKIDSSDEKVCAAICICFRIRNNLFHGEKVFWLLNQQKAIIDACSAFLNEIINEDLQISFINP